MNVETPGPAELNLRRDLYVLGMRAVVDRFKQIHPEKMEGILGRASAVLEAQIPFMDLLERVDLDGAQQNLGQTFEALLRAQHLPRAVIAFGEVLYQEEKSLILRPVVLEAAELGRELLLLTQVWIERNQEQLKRLEDEEEVY